MTLRPEELLAAYDTQLRGRSELKGATDVQRHGPLWWGLFDGAFGFCTYRDLEGAEGAALDHMIESTLSHFRDQPGVVSFEWKVRGHDRPPDLGDRLRAHGLVPEDIETVMIGEASLLAADVPAVDGVTIRRAGDDGDLGSDVERATAMQDAVFGRPSSMGASSLVASLSAEPRLVELWFAEAEGEVASAGRIDVYAETEFAGLWGGATRADWRGRGIYRALTAARARSALALGARYLTSDCTEMSRPILERSGLVPVTTTTPFVWTRP